MTREAETYGQKITALVAELPVPLRLVRAGLLVDNLRENRRDSWDRLRDDAEAPRYAEVRRLTEAYARGGFVLDVGCSQGILQEGLTYRRYLGVDASAPAIALAHRRSDDRTDFVVGDAVTFAPDEAPDLVVLNEILYYLPDPVGTVERYLGLVSERGVVVVSVWARAWSTRRLIRQLHARWPVVESVPVGVGALSWLVAVFGRPGTLRPG